MASEKIFDCFLEQTEYVDFFANNIDDLCKTLFSSLSDEAEKARNAFNFVRDKIPHSFDIDYKLKPAEKASDVLASGTGICHTKALLLAALLRHEGIPTGFCFQRLTFAEDDSMGYCVHAMNAVFLRGKWHPLDARGNNDRVSSEFSLDKPSWAHPPREQYEEYFFNGIFAYPHYPTLKLLSEVESIYDLSNGVPDSVTVKPEIEFDLTDI